MIPGSALLPSMLCVFPVAVIPYAKTARDSHAGYRALFTRFENCLEKSSLFVVSAS